MKSEFIQIPLLFICASASLIASVGPLDFGDAKCVLGNAEAEEQNPQPTAWQGAQEARVGEASLAGDNKTPPDSDIQTVVKLPDRIEAQPTKVIHTSETQIETVIVDHIREHHLAEGRPPVYVDRYEVRKHQK